MSQDTENAINFRPILWFIGITFAATYGLQFILIANGIRFDTDVVSYTPTPLLLITMWLPGLTALLVTKCIEGRTWKELVPALSLRMGSVGPYFLMFFLAPLLFAIMYGVSWALGMSTPDLTMSALTEATGSQETFTPETIFQVILPLSALVGPLIHFVFSLGEELGWRGFLLTRLMPLGKVRAYCILGIIWGLWHAPLIWVGFNYPEHPVGGIAMMCVLTTAFGFFLNEMTLHYKSVFLAAFIHGAINAQGDGIWMWVFPDINPLLGGGTGLTAIIIWGITGIACHQILTRLKAS